jgi:hypothetical protein
VYRFFKVNYPKTAVFLDVTLYSLTLKTEVVTMKLTQNYWVVGLCPSSGIVKPIKHNVSETGSVSVLR